MAPFDTIGYLNPGSFFFERVILGDIVILVGLLQLGAKELVELVGNVDRERAVVDGYQRAQDFPLPAVVNYRLMWSGHGIDGDADDLRFQNEVIPPFLWLSEECREWMVRGASDHYALPQKSKSLRV